MTLTRAPLTNKEVGEKLGISETAVSRYRTGVRHPKFPVQQAIERVFGWPVADQAVAHAREAWGAEFEAALCRSQDAPA